MFDCSKQGSVFVLAGNEPLTRDHIGDLVAVSGQCFNQGQPKIVLSLQEMPLIDSAGLELLLDLRDRCQQRGGTLHLAAPSALCREILSATQLAREFAIFDDVLTAVGSFSQ